MKPFEGKKKTWPDNVELFIWNGQSWSTSLYLPLHCIAIEGDDEMQCSPIVDFQLARVNREEGGGGLDTEHWMERSTVKQDSSCRARGE